MGDERPGDEVRRLMCAIRALQMRCGTAVRSPGMTQRTSVGISQMAARPTST